MLHCANRQMHSIRNPNVRQHPDTSELTFLCERKTSEILFRLRGVEYGSNAARHATPLPRDLICVTPVSFDTLPTRSTPPDLPNPSAGASTPRVIGVETSHVATTAGARRREHRSETNMTARHDIEITKRTHRLSPPSLSLQPPSEKLAAAKIRCQEDSCGVGKAS